MTENNVVVKSDYTYNYGNLVTNKTTTNSAGTALQTDNYSYLCDGNVFTENDKSYTYDLRNRLSGVAQDDEDNKNYTFDSLGNRLTKTIGSDTISYTYDKNNRILSQSNSAGTTNYSYDDRGNLYLKTVSFVDDSLTSPTAQPMSISDTDSQMFEFDGFNRMSGFETGSTTAEYEYDSSGLRTSKTVSGERTEFVLDGIYVIAEINADGDVTNYIRGLTGIVYRETPDNVKTYYVTNNHGDVTKLVNSSGQIIESYTYDEFGNELNIDSTDDNPFRYCGEYYDKESGLIYLRARYYDPTIGRFISEDPAMDDLNWYVYCASNPLNFWDPSGKINSDDGQYDINTVIVLFYETIAYGISQKYDDELGMSYAKTMANAARNKQLNYSTYATSSWQKETISSIVNAALDYAEYYDENSSDYAFVAGIKGLQFISAFEQDVLFESGKDFVYENVSKAFGPFVTELYDKGFFENAFSNDEMANMLVICELLDEKNVDFTVHVRTSKNSVGFLISTEDGTSEYLFCERSLY